MPGKPFLQEKQGLNRGARVSPDELPHRGLREFRGVNFRRAHVPPCRRLPAMVEADESELPRIAENKREVLLTKDEVIVFTGLKSCGLDPQFSAHSKVNPEPVPA